MQQGAASSYSSSIIIIIIITFKIQRMREMLVRPVYEMTYVFIFTPNMDRIHIFLSLVVLSVPQIETLQVTEISGELRPRSSGRLHGKQWLRTSWLSRPALSIKSTRALPVYTLNSTNTPVFIGY